MDCCSRHKLTNFFFTYLYLSIVHLHGHIFQVVAWGKGPHDYYHGNPSSTNSWMLEKPVERDIVLVGANIYVIIRYRADNYPGAWLFHCHTVWQFYTGMVAVMIESPEVAQQRESVDPYLAELCQVQGLHAYGNTAGKKGRDPVTQWHPSPADKPSESPDDD